MSFTIITGFSGFVGQNLIPYLEKRDINIVRIERKDLNNLNPSDFHSDCNIIHLAGKAHDLKKTANADEYYHINYELTKKLYDTFLNSDARKFIFVSSIKAATDSSPGLLTENFAENPQSDYGKSKLLAEKYIQNQPLPENKRYYILRPCMIHGPGNKGNLNLLFKFIQRGIPYPLGSFENKRSFLSIENLSFVISELLNQDVKSGVYQIADDEAISTTDLIKILSKSIGKKPKLININQKIIRLVAKIGDIVKFPLNTERLNKLTENYIVSNEKIKKAMNTSLPVSAREGLSLTAESFKKG